VAEEEAAEVPEAERLAQPDAEQLHKVHPARAEPLEHRPLEHLLQDNADPLPARQVLQVRAAVQRRHRHPVRPPRRLQMPARIFREDCRISRGLPNS